MNEPAPPARRSDRSIGHRWMPWLSLGLAACGASPAAPQAATVVVMKAEDVEPSGSSLSRPSAAPKCVVEGEQLGSSISLLLPGRGEAWASMRKGVAGRYRLTVPAAGRDQAEVAIETDVVRIEATTPTSSVSLYAPAPLPFGPVVTSHIGHPFGWRPSEAGGIRLELRLGVEFRPTTLEREVPCDDVKLGGVPHVLPELPDGFESETQLRGPGLIPLYADARTGQPAIQADGTRMVSVLLGRSVGDRREVHYRGDGFTLQAWVLAEHLDTEMYGLGTIGTTGRGGLRGVGGPELILVCPHRVPLHAVIEGVSFPVATLEVGPEIQLYAHEALAEGLQPVVVPELPLDLRPGVQLATKPAALEGCTPPRGTR